MKILCIYNALDMNDRQLCRKFLKKRIKIEGCFITCDYIWHFYTLKYLYWSDAYSVKVWWRYVLPNSNAIHFCDFIFRHRTVLTCQRNLFIKKYMKFTKIFYLKVEDCKIKESACLNIKICRQNPPEVLLWNRKKEKEVLRRKHKSVKICRMVHKSL